MKRITVLLLVIILSSAMLAGCNTIRGVGKDVEKAGEVIQNSTK
ncbi:MAG: entericidin A/B family lipoprotein [Thermodesulfobacteriota bacterium]|nr:MAG: entericidin A/B family lipoprotein [Thermodesulfobacteriota bacterium]